MLSKILAVATLITLAQARGTLAYDYEPYPQPYPPRTGGYSMEVVDEGGNILPTYHQGGGVHVLGAYGQRYMLRIRNGSGQRIEVVASVDGRDVIDGKRAGYEKRGYIVEPYGEVNIDGFRLSDNSVAAFRFSKVSRWYAARMGDARDVGVIGAAIFAERRYYPPPPPRPYRPLTKKFGDGAGARDESAAPAEAEPGPTPSSPPTANAPSKSSEARSRSDSRPGLGTEFGEEHYSSVQSVEFRRASSRPASLLSLRYNDRDGLIALGIDVDGRQAYRGDDIWLRETAEPFRNNGSYAQPPAGWSR